MTSIHRDVMKALSAEHVDLLHAVLGNERADLQQGRALALFVFGIDGLFSHATLLCPALSLRTEFTAERRWSGLWWA